MEQTKHYFEEAQELMEFNEFLQKLIDMGHLDNPALGITKKVIAEGRESLSKQQDYVFRTHVLDKFVTEECSFLTCNIPWSEMYEALDNGGYCGYCVHKMEKLASE
ncbi:MAG TPA: hypothetical protein V6C85_01440 [Allocoleopsis sp.]